MIGRTLGHYRILEKIGAGGMGEVYRAHDERLDRDVAVKVLPAGTLTDEAARSRFRREALALSKLSHPNIETVHDFDTQGGVVYLVIEYLSGTTLKEKLASGPLTEKEVASLGAQIAEALEAAHEQGIVHRDLKPGNVMVTPKGQAKVLDFGLAKVAPPSSAAPGAGQRPALPTAADESLTHAGVLVGTMPYMAPEQLRGEAVDARTDLYALGATLYEMATGRRPFPESAGPQLSDAILHQTPVTPRALNARISPELERTTLKCLEKDPENRYQSAKEVKVDLRRLQTPTVISAAVGAGPRARPWEGARWGAPLRKPWFAAIATVVVVAAVLVALNVAGLRDRLLSAVGALRAVPLQKIESIAVLPLENLSRDPEQEYFADGLTEELTASLGQIGALRVISRTSVMQYKAARPKGGIREIARQLNVDAVVEGSVRRSGDRVRITAQLIDAKADRHLWARSYERDLRDILALQSEVARAVADEVRVKLTPDVQARLSRAHPVNPDAYAAYLRGRFYRSRAGPEGKQRAIEHFQRAIQIDAGYALAYASLAEVYAAQGTAELLAIYPHEIMPKAREAALKVLSLDDSLAEGHTALGAVKLFYEWDWAGAERAFERAFEFNPNYVDTYHWSSHLKTVQGRREESLRASLRALELDPLSAQMGAHLAWHYLMARQYDEAIQACRKTLEFQPESNETLDFLGRSYAAKGLHSEAIAEFRKVVELSRGNPRYLAVLASGYAQGGRRREALALLDRVERLSRQGFVSGYDMAAAYTALGEKEKAFKWLEKAYEDRTGWIVYLRLDYRFDPLRPDPRFQDLLRRMNFPQ